MSSIESGTRRRNIPDAIVASRQFHTKRQYNDIRISAHSVQLSDAILSFYGFRVSISRQSYESFTVLTRRFEEDPGVGKGRFEIRTRTYTRLLGLKGCR